MTITPEGRPARSTRARWEVAGHVIEAERPDVHLGVISAFLTGAALPLPAYTGTSAPTP